MNVVVVQRKIQGVKMIDIKPKSGFQRLFSEFRNWTAAAAAVGNKWLIGVSDRRLRFESKKDKLSVLSVPLIDNCVYFRKGSYVGGDVLF